MEEAIGQIQDQLARLLLIQELVVTSLDRTSVQIVDVSKLTQAAEEDLRHLREKFLENGIGVRIDSTAAELSGFRAEAAVYQKDILNSMAAALKELRTEATVDRKEIVTALGKIEQTTGGLLVKLMIGTLGAIGAIIAAIAWGLLSGLISKGG